MVIILCVLFYFRAGLWRGAAYLGHKIFNPVLLLGGRVESGIVGAKAYFVSKKTLSSENQNLQSELAQERITMLNYNSVLAENASLKETLGRIPSKAQMVLAAILAAIDSSWACWACTAFTRPIWRCTTVTASWRSAHALMTG